jgi:hypothetical protein
MPGEEIGEAGVAKIGVGDGDAGKAAGLLALDNVGEPGGPTTGSEA